MIPSGKVRVLNYLPYLRNRSVKCKVLDYHHPSILRWCERQQPESNTLFLLFRIARRILRYVDLCHQRWIELQLLFISGRYDAVLIQWELLPVLMLRKMLKRNPNLVFDYDDPVFLGSEDRANFVLTHSKVVIAGSQYLRSYAEKWNKNVFLIPSSIPIERFDYHRWRASHKHGSRVVIGWIGTQSTLHHLDILTNVFDGLCKGYDLELKIVGAGSKTCPIAAVGKLKVTLIDRYDEEEMIHHAFSFDIGIVPLKDTGPSFGKTALKTLVYMAAGVPVVCTPTEANLELVVDGVSGFLASTEGDWIEKLARLIVDPPLRRKIGKQGLTICRKGYTTRRCSELFCEALDSLVLGDAEGKTGVDLA